MDRIRVCQDVIETNSMLVNTEVECDYLSQEGAKVLTIMVHTLAKEGLTVNKKNRKVIPGIAWDNMSMLEMGNIMLTMFNLSDAAIYISVKIIQRWYQNIWMMRSYTYLNKGVLYNGISIAYLRY